MEGAEIQKGFADFSGPVKRKILKKISKPCKILIMSHKYPDGDAVGSALGLARVMELAGHEVKVCFPDEAPDFIKWLPGYKNALIFEKAAKSFPGFTQDPDIVFFVDFNTPERLGAAADMINSLKGLKILVDHHPGSDPFFDLALIDTSRGSTAELLVLMLENLGLASEIDQDAALCFYTGIITDTLGLQVNSSYPGIYRVVGLLIEKGADIQKVYSNVYHQFSAGRMKLLGYCLAEKMKLLPEYGAAYIWITKDELARFNHIKGDTEGFVNYPLSIKDIRFSVLFTELPDEIKLSLRSTGNIPVNEFAAKYFNGGGHLNAAGGRSTESMQETIDRFDPLVKSFMAKYL